MKAFDIRYNKNVEIIKKFNNKIVKIKLPNGDKILENIEVLVNPKTYEPIEVKE